MSNKTIEKTIELIKSFSLGEMLPGDDPESRELLEILATGIVSICIKELKNVMGEPPTPEDFLDCARVMLAETIRDALRLYLVEERHAQGKNVPAVTTG
jgi:hypothetical protein